MLKTLKFACILLVAMSCRREYAYFQKTTAENFSQPKPKATAQKQPIAQEMPANNMAENEHIAIPHEPLMADMIATNETEVLVNNGFGNGPVDLFPKGLFKKKSKVSAKTKRTGVFKKDENRLFPKKKAKKRRDSFGHKFNERLKIGLVLLGIAIIFALLHITVLTIIFGILAAFMIIRGLRKLF